MSNYTDLSLRIVNDALSDEERLDANETAFLERELTQLRARVYDVKYGAIKGLSLLPLATDIAPSANTFSYKVYDHTGKAKIISDGNDDSPRVDISATEVTGKVYTLGDSYGWDIQEMREAARLRVPLSEKRALAARRVLAQGVDDMLLTGVPSGESSNVVTTGLSNNANVTVHSSDFTHWVAATDDDTMLNELNDLVNTTIAGLKGNEDLYPDTLALPETRFLVLNSKRLGVDANMTVLEFFLKNNAFVKNVVSWHRLDDAGASSKDRAVLYKKDPMCVEAVVPVVFEQLAPQARNYSHVVNCMSRCGGVAVYHPTSMRYRDFADA